MNIARAYNNWMKYRQTVSELGRMSNRELGDLGLVGKQQPEMAARDAGERPFDVVVPPNGRVDPDDPARRAARRRYATGLVAEHRDPGTRQPRRDVVAARPVIVVAQDAKDAERRVQLPEQRQWAVDVAR